MHSSLIILCFQLLTSEKKARQEIEELRQQVRRLQENERKERRKLAEEDALKKIKRLEEANIELSRSLAAQKQVSKILRVIIFLGVFQNSKDIPCVIVISKICNKRICLYGSTCNIQPPT